MASGQSHPSAPQAAQSKISFFWTAFKKWLREGFLGFFMSLLFETDFWITFVRLGQVFKNVWNNQSNTDIGETLAPGWLGWVFVAIMPIAFVVGIIKALFSAARTFTLRSNARLLKMLDLVDPREGVDKKVIDETEIEEAKKKMSLKLFGYAKTVIRGLKEKSYDKTLKTLVDNLRKKKARKIAENAKKVEEVANAKIAEELEKNKPSLWDRLKNVASTLWSGITKAWDVLSNASMVLWLSWMACVLLFGLGAVVAANSIFPLIITGIVCVVTAAVYTLQAIFKEDEKKLEADKQTGRNQEKLIQRVFMKKEHELEKGYYFPQNSHKRKVKDLEKSLSREQVVEALPKAEVLIERLLGSDVEWGARYGLRVFRGGFLTGWLTTIFIFWLLATAFAAVVVALPYLSVPLLSVGVTGMVGTVFPSIATGAGLLAGFFGSGNMMVAFGTVAAVAYTIKALIDGYNGRDKEEEKVRTLLSAEYKNETTADGSPKSKLQKFLELEAAIEEKKKLIKQFRENNNAEIETTAGSIETLKAAIKPQELWLEVCRKYDQEGAISYAALKPSAEPSEVTIDAEKKLAASRAALKRAKLLTYPVDKIDFSDPDSSYFRRQRHEISWGSWWRKYTRRAIEFVGGFQTGSLLLRLTALTTSGCVLAGFFPASATIFLTSCLIMGLILGAARLSQYILDRRQARREEFDIDARISRMRKENEKLHYLVEYYKEQGLLAAAEPKPDGQNPDLFVMPAQAGIQNVGWVERSETQRSEQRQPPYQDARFSPLDKKTIDKCMLLPSLSRPSCVLTAENPQESAERALSL